MSLPGTTDDAAHLERKQRDCGADGWAVTPSGSRGVRNDAVSIYFLDATLASAFVKRWVCWLPGRDGGRGISAAGWSWRSLAGRLGIKSDAWYRRGACLWRHKGCPLRLAQRGGPRREEANRIESGWKAMALGAGIGLAMLSYPVHAAPASGGDTVQGLYEALLTTMKNGRTLGQSGRFTQLEPVIRRTVDIPSMARLSVGPSWASLTEAQRQQVTESFGRYISAIYADRFDSYAGQKLQVIGEQPAAAGIMVHSQIVKANGEPVNVDYMMRRNGDSWLISDIYLDGAISEVATRRSEFAAIVKSQGIDGLIAALNRKADILTATTAKAS
jgi:phospholipid transport system substrate-binding protein